MNNLHFSRRDFLRQSGVAGGALLFDSLLSDDLAFAAVPTVRKDIDSLTAAELTSLRNGISVMKSRPITNRTSWLYQANIHGHPFGPASPAWDTCQHGSFYFLSWHRMYLYFFERILRAASGDPNLTLPYWNYSKSMAARALPLPFRTPFRRMTPRRG